MAARHCTATPLLLLAVSLAAAAAAAAAETTTTRAPLTSTREPSTEESLDDIKRSSHKFDQVDSVECVDAQFYSTLLRDLRAVKATKRLEQYADYYDVERAKTVESLVSTSGALASDARVPHSNESVLSRTRDFWTKTRDEFEARALNETASMAPEAEQRVYDNYARLLARLDELKRMLLDGEEALVVLSNHVKQLPEAVEQLTERKLAALVCDCVTSRGGRAALMLVSELLVDKHASEAMRDLAAARRKALAAARDTAQFCSFWYADTMRHVLRVRAKHVRHKLRAMSAAQRHSSAADLAVRDLQQLGQLLYASARWAPKLADYATRQLANMTRLLLVRKKRALASQADSESHFSTPFDGPEQYQDMDYLGEPDAGALSFILNNYGRRRKRDTVSESGDEFDARVRNNATQCAKHSFEAMLELAVEQNELVYERRRVDEARDYVREARETYSNTFERLWTEARDEWQRKFAQLDRREADERALRRNNKAPQDDGANEDEEDEDDDNSDDDELVETSYDRGARLGFVVGEFVGAKAAKQWPDPAELNTITYDSLFLAGVGQGHAANESRALERRIVLETAKRVAYVAANRRAFARTLHSAYLNGAYTVPHWGLYHAQRVVAWRNSHEGAKAGQAGAASAADSFSAHAMRFIDTHRRQRALAAPYKQLDGNGGSSGDARKDDISEMLELAQVRAELTRASSECGERAGTLMGALMGMLVVPEGFEAYVRARGSLLALGDEFNMFKLGALRGYHLGETFSYLNQTEAARLSLARAGDTLRRFESPEPQTNARNDDDDEKLDKNNVFKFVLTNYAPARNICVALHSREAPLRPRTLRMPKALLRELKAHTGDLVAPSDDAAREQHKSTREKQMEMSSELSGKLKLSRASERALETSATNASNASRIDGAASTTTTTSKQVKLVVLTSSPSLEFEQDPALDNADARERASRARQRLQLALMSAMGKQTASGFEAQNGTATNSTRLAQTPLTAALSKITKVYVKMRWPTNRDEHADRSNDDLFAFVVGASKGRAQGAQVGYADGAYSRLASRLQMDDFGREAAALDELFERIESVQTP